MITRLPTIRNLPASCKAIPAIIAFFLYAFTGCAGSKPAQEGPPPPPPVPLIAPVGEPPTSTLRIPVEVDLDFVRDRIMKTLPKPLSQKVVQKKVQVGSLPFSPELGVEFRHRAEVESIDLRMDGSQFQATTRINFAVGGSVVATHLDLGVGSCGEKIGEPPPTLEVTVKGRFAWGNDAKILFAASPLELKWIRPCNLTAFKVKLEDILDLPMVRTQIQSAINQAIDQIPDQIRIRPMAELAWREMERPRSVLPGVWLVVRPESLSLGPITGTGKRISTSITLRAKPSLTDSVRNTDTLRRLPSIRVERPGDGMFHLEAQAFMPLSMVDSLLTANLSAKTFQAGGKDIHIAKATLYGGGDKAVLGVTLDKPFEGTIFLKGRPEFDTVTKSVRLADVDFDVDTKSFLVKSASYLAHGSIQEAIAKAATVDMAQILPKVSDLRFPMGDLGTVQVGLQTLQPVGISLDQGRLQAWLRTSGKVQVSVGTCVNPCAPR
ncbi:MAG: DUF4403 family protein [Fibrobacteres bacterium]|nr:DUF4403 family protein [Fibrobacterota bacterium]